MDQICPPFYVIIEKQNVIQTPNLSKIHPLLWIFKRFGCLKGFWQKIVTKNWSNRTNLILSMLQVQDNFTGYCTSLAELFVAKWYVPVVFLKKKFMNATLLFEQSVFFLLFLLHKNTRIQSCPNLISRDMLERTAFPLSGKYVLP